MKTKIQLFTMAAFIFIVCLLPGLPADYFPR